MKRLFTLVALVAVVAAGLFAKVPFTKLDNGSYQFFMNAFGDSKCVGMFAFTFSITDVEGRLMVLDKEFAPNPEGDDIAFKFDSAEAPELVFSTTKGNGNEFSFSFNRNNAAPDDEINYFVGYFMNLFIQEKLRAISIGSLTIPGPYPSKTDFMEMFDKAADLLPAAEWVPVYKRFRAQIPAAAPASSAGKAADADIVPLSTTRFAVDKLTVANKVDANAFVVTCSVTNIGQLPDETTTVRVYAIDEADHAVKVKGKRTDVPERYQRYVKNDSSVRVDTKAYAPKVNSPYKWRIPVEIFTIHSASRPAAVRFVVEIADRSGNVKARSISAPVNL